MHPPPNEYRSGFVAVAGRPNVGKSTLVNRIAGRELSIVTPKAQTTRHRVSAIVTLPRGQMVLQDTPGIHEATTALNRALVGAAVKALQDGDVVLHMVSPRREIHPEDYHIMRLIGQAKLPAVLALNKVDMMEQERVSTALHSYAAAYEYRHTVAISALTGQGVDELTGTLVGLLPIGPQLFPEDDASDLPVRFFIAEIVREQVTMLTGQEVPYKTTVVVESFKEEENRVVIIADIHTERQSQKKILVGKGGQMIKKIGMAARIKAEAFLGRPVRLELFVKVTPNWTRNPRMVEELLDSSPGSS